MSDLGVRVGAGYFPASRIMAAPVVNLDRVVGPETLHLLETIVSRSLGLWAVVSETLHVSGANTVSAARGPSGLTAFQASAGHATVTNYTARLRVSGNSTVVDTSSLGVPTPDGNGVIIVDLTSFFAGQAAGNYTISILATDAGGSTDSEESDAFTLPLP